MGQEGGWWGRKVNKVGGVGRKVGGAGRWVLGEGG